MACFWLGILTDRRKCRSSHLAAYIACQVIIKIHQCFQQIGRHVGEGRVALGNRGDELGLVGAALGEQDLFFGVFAAQRFLDVCRHFGDDWLSGYGNPESRFSAAVYTVNIDYFV